MDFFDGYGLFGRKPPGADKENGMGELRWIKVATDLFENRKIRYLLRQPDGEKMVLMWIRLLCFAGRINDRGRVYFTEELPLDAATLADDAGCPQPFAARVLDELARLSMTDTDGGVLHIRNWGEFQEAENLEQIRKNRARRNARYYQHRKEAGKTPEGVLIRRSTESEPEPEPESQPEAEAEPGTETPVSVFGDGGTEQNGFPEIRPYRPEEAGENEPDERLPDPRTWAEPEDRLMRLGGLGKDVVFLTDRQIGQLLELMSVEVFDEYLERLADYILKRQIHVRNHYETLLSWYRRDAGLEPESPKTGKG